jgi:hypothetical protein
MSSVTAAPGYTGTKALLLAGLAAGMAEVVWIALYAAFTPVDALEVARSITATFGEAGAAAAAAGLGIHLVLSLAVAAVFIALVYRPLREFLGARAIVACALGVLAMIWVTNFFVVLPAINPAFTELMPLPVTLVSKLLFGLALALTLLRTSPARN